MFFFVTLYMQNILGYSPLQAGVAYIPAATGVIIAAGVCSNLFARTGTRPLLIIGALFAAAGMFWLSRAPQHGHYLPDLLPGLIIMGLGLGAVVVGVQTAANAGVPEDLAGLAAALITACFQIGVAIGLAIFSAVATSHTHSLLASGHITPRHAQLSGYQLALFVAGTFLVAAAAVATRATNTKGEPIKGVDAIAEELRPILKMEPAAHT
jgi:MFS family permease